jgi:hypothetical protein
MMDVVQASICGSLMGTAQYLARLDPVFRPALLVCQRPVRSGYSILVLLCPSGIGNLRTIA